MMGDHVDIVHHFVHFVLGVEEVGDVCPGRTGEERGRFVDETCDRLDGQFMWLDDCGVSYESEATCKKGAVVAVGVRPGRLRVK